MADYSKPDPGLNSLTSTNVYRAVREGNPYRKRREIKRQRDKLNLKLECENGPMKVCVQQVMAWYEYCLDEPESTDSAAVICDKILEVYPKNVNSLALKKKIAHSQKRLDDVRKFSSEINTALEDELCILQCLSEQAFARTADINIEVDSCDVVLRLQNCISYYEKLLERYKLLHKPDGRQQYEWFYVMARTYLRMHDAFQCCQKQDCRCSQSLLQDSLDAMLQSLRYFSRAERIEDIFYKGRILCYQGHILAHIKSNSWSKDHVNKTLEQLGLLDKNPKTCFEEALEMAKHTPKNYRALAQYGYNLLKCKDYSNARNFLKESLQCEKKPEKNWFAYNKLGKVLLDLSKNDLKEESKVLLTESLKCLCKAKQFAIGTFQAKCIYGIGKCNCKLGKLLQDPSYYNEAIKCYEELKQCPFGAGLPKVHHRQAECLLETKNPTGALECLKTAINVDFEEEAEPTSLNLYLRTSLDLYYTSDIMSNSEERRILATDIMYWLKIGLNKYKKEKLNVVLETLCEDDKFLDKVYRVSCECVTNEGISEIESIKHDGCVDIVQKLNTLIQTVNKHKVPFTFQSPGENFKFHVCLICGSSEDKNLPIDNLCSWLTDDLKLLLCDPLECATLGRPVFSEYGDAIDNSEKIVVILTLSLLEHEHWDIWNHLLLTDQKRSSDTFILMKERIAHHMNPFPSFMKIHHYYKTPQKVLQQLAAFLKKDIV